MRLLNIQKVLDKVCLSRSTVIRLQAAGHFPSHTQSTGVTLWLESEIDEWIKASMEKRETFEPAPESPYAGLHSNPPA